MPYIHRRKKGLVDLLIEEDFKEVITIKDKDRETPNQSFVIRIGDATFVVTKADLSLDESEQIAESLKNLIEDSGLLVDVEVIGPEITVRPTYYDPSFRVEVGSTSRDEVISIRRIEAEGYQILGASNWDLEFQELIRIPRQGTKTSGTPQDIINNNSAFRKRCRFRFHPRDLGLEEDQILFLKIIPIYGGDPLDTSGRIVTILTSDQMDGIYPAVVLGGTVPQGQTRGEAIELTLPALTRSFEIKNVEEGGGKVLVSFGGAGAEIPLASGEHIRSPFGGSGRISLRSEDAAGTDVTIMMIITHNVVL